VQNNLGLASKIPLVFSRAIFYLQNLEKSLNSSKSIIGWPCLRRCRSPTNCTFFFLGLATIMQLFNNIDMPSNSIDLFIFHMIIRTHKYSSIVTLDLATTHFIRLYCLIDEFTLDTNKFSLPSICEQILSLTIFPYSLQGAIVILCHTK